MTEVLLHRLSGSKKAYEACRLVDELYRAGKRVVVWVADEGRAGVLNDYLWTFSPNAFVPHALSRGAEVEEPVAIVTGALVNPNGADVLVVADAAPEPSLAAAFSEVHELLTASEEDQRKPSLWSGAGFTVREAGA